MNDLDVTILCDVRCHLGEGAGYDASSGTAWWFDILERRLFEARPDSGEVEVHELPVMASALAVIDDGRQLVAAEDGLYLRVRSTRTMELIHPIRSGRAQVRSNDARVHPSGTFWFSMMGRRAETGAGAIFALQAGSIHHLFQNLSIPNSICFTADGTTGFFSDTARNELYRVHLDPATGLPVSPASLVFRSDEAAGLDGAVIDAAGLIWIARWGGGRVDAFSTAGELVRSIAVPALQPSCPVFVGRALDKLLVTSALEGMDDAARAADPHGGRTFVIHNAAQGRPEPRVLLRLPP